MGSPVLAPFNFVPPKRRKRKHPSCRGCKGVDPALYIQAREMRRSGLSCQAIGDALGLSLAWAARVVKGVPLPEGPSAFGMPISVDWFWAQVGRSVGIGACWQWKNCCASTGYGVFNRRGTLYAAHRVAWILTHGPIPKDGPGYHGWCVCHTCDNPPCCNPAHLFLGGQNDNLQDAARKGHMPRWGQRNRILSPERG